MPKDKNKDSKDKDKNKGSKDKDKDKDKKKKNPKVISVASQLKHIGFSDSTIKSLQSAMSEKQFMSYANNILKSKANGKKNKKTKTSVAKEAAKSASGVGNSNATSLRTFGLYNTPHQFTSIADPRVTDGDWRGRCYTEHILQNSPTVLFKVGKPSYMKGNSDASVSDLANAMFNEDDLGSLDKFFSATDNNMYYYTFEDAFDSYCQYVNGMVRYTAVKMGISEYKDFNLNDDKHRNDNWFTDFFSGALGLSKYVAFYADASGTSAGESGSNTSGDSQLASGVKSLGQTKRELNFLFGKDTSANANAAQESYNSFAESLKKKYTNMDGISGVLNKITGTFTSVASGANVLFPEVWQDSSYRFNYNVTIKLSSPYGDIKSIFENVYVPFFILLAMALPRQSGAQGYTGPFLVQCFSKGFFSCNLGMVEQIDVKKGGSSGNDWTVDDLPTEIEVSMSIKDLYPTMIGSSLASQLAFANNVGLSSYLKMMAGVQLIDFDPASNIEEVLNTFTTGIKDIPSRIYNAGQNTIGSGAKSIMEKVFKGMN